MGSIGVKFAPERWSDEAIQGLIVFPNLSLDIIKTEILADELLLMHPEGKVIR